MNPTLQFLTALVAGGMGGLVAPGISWQIEKRRDLRRRRAEKILAARLGLIDWWENRASTNRQASLSDVRPIQMEVWFASLSAHMDPGAKRAIAKSMSEQGSVAELPTAIDLTGAELDRLERAWGL